MKDRSLTRRLPVRYSVLAVILVLMLTVVSCAPQAAETPPGSDVQPTAVEEEPAPTEAAPEPTVAEAEPTVAEAEPTAPAAEEPEPTAGGSTYTEDLSPSIPAPDEPVTVSFASWVGGGEAYQTLAEQFNELYPNITIEFQDVPFEEIRTKLLTQAAANNPPDVAYLSSGDVGAFAQRDALVDLEPFMAVSSVVVKEDYVPAFLDATIVEGKVYGLPITAETTGLFYRTDLFEAAGLDPTKPPENWDQFLEYAQKLTDTEKKQYGFALFASEAAYYWYPWLWQAGGELISEDGQDVLWDSEAGQRAAEFYVGLREFSPPDFLASNSWDGRVAFANGTVAMYEAGAWFAGTLQSEFPDANGKWATAPMPEDEQCATTIAGDALVVFKGSKNPEAAWKWIEFLSAPENMKLINLGTPDNPTTLLPPLTPLLEDPAIYENNPVLKGFADNMACAVNFSTDQEAWPEMETFLNEALGAAIYGEIDAQTAVTQSAQEAESLIK